MTVFDHCESCLTRINLDKDNFIRLKKYQYGSLENICYFCSEECLIEIMERR